MKIEYAKSAVKYIESLDKSTKQRIKTGIEGLTENPPKGDIKSLQGYSDGRKRLMEVLPESEQNFALEFIKKPVISWYPYFTKLTSAERYALEKSEKDIAENGTIPHNAINWD